MIARRNCGILLSLIFLGSIYVASSSSSCKTWLVQSVPTDMPRLPLIDGVLSTGDVLQWLAGNSSKNLDIIAQYWQLLAQPKNPLSGDYGFSDADMERFGAEVGQKVYSSLENAVDRMVNIRIVQHSGVYPDFVDETSDLAAGKPNVQNVTLLLGKWWGSGIVHAKVWISDGRSVYIGSANNDWKSLTQVKEVGIYLNDCPDIVEKVTMYFNNLWTLSFLNSSASTVTVWDEQWQSRRKVPCWSHFVNQKERCRSPLPHYIEVPHVAGYPILSDPFFFHIPMETPGQRTGNISDSHTSQSYLSFAPPELSFGRFPADEQGWVDTIKSVKFRGIVRISSMDWLGQSEYATQPIYWSTLSAAVSEVIFTKKATVKILVAYWAHFIENTEQYLKSLLYSNILCSSSKRNKCSGKVEIKYYKVPGFNSTGPALKSGKSTGNLYPGYTRVNHGKYAVSDVRAHIGTSNLVWDYFYSTAGVSFGTYHPALISQLQKIFDADWNSPYATDVQPLIAPS
ncbi:uncharacterized protein LOC144708367 [Wolffia australiana]